MLFAVPICLMWLISCLYDIITSECLELAVQQLILLKEGLLHSIGSTHPHDVTDELDLLHHKIRIVLHQAPHP